MKTLKWLFFLIIFTLSFLLLFSVVNLQFVLFHFILIFIFFFPYYFWVYSAKTLTIALFLIFIFSSFMFYGLQKIPQKNLTLGSSAPVLNIEPKVSKVFFQFSHQSYAYDFNSHQLKIEKEAPLFPRLFNSPLFTTYQKTTQNWIQKYQFLPFSLQSASVLLWIFSSILIAFIFSYKSSLLLSYSNIFLIIPYTLYAADKFYLKPITLPTLAIQGGFFIALSLLSFIRVRS